MAWSSSSKSQSPPELNVVQPYRMHVSQKYLDLTRQKLELTRLPREPRFAQNEVDFGVVKHDLEPLLDHWLESYDWRAQELYYNDALPQFRVPINATRLHYVHQRSASASAIPLLIIHGWPESFITSSKVIDALCNPITTPPRGDDSIQAFHVVVPSIPGFAFSEPVPEVANNIHGTAEVFDALMKGLGYGQYMIHGSGWGFRIARMLTLLHPESCLALHTVNPEVPAPRSTFGYLTEDVAAFSDPMSNLSLHTPGLTPPLTPALSSTVRDRPQTSAYGLCDSPIGLMAHMLDAIQPPHAASPSPAHSPATLRIPPSIASPMTPQSAGLSPQPSRSPHSPAGGAPAYWDSGSGGQLASPWSPMALVNWTMLYWLPGPEVALRWLTNSSHFLPTLWTGFNMCPIGVTLFREATMGAGEHHTPPQWLEAYHRVAMIKRREGRVRFALWERPGDVVLDIREFAGLLNSRPPTGPSITNGM